MRSVPFVQWSAQSRADDAQRFVSLSKRHRGALSCISFDLDHFKHINDTYEHAGGDQVLVAVAKATASLLRKSDLVGRLGGEELAVLLPHTDSLQALEVADKLRLMFRGAEFSRQPAADFDHGQFRDFDARPCYR